MDMEEVRILYLGTALKLLKTILIKREIKPFIVLLIIFSLILSFIIQIGLNIYYRTQPRNFPKTWATFTYQTYEFSVDYPKNWHTFKMFQGNHGDVEEIGLIGEGIRCFGCVRLWDGGPSIYIAFKEIEDATMDQALIWGEERIEENSKGNIYELGETQITEINGFPAVFRTYQHRTAFSNELEPAIDAYIVRDNSALIFSLITEPKDYEEIVPIFNAIVESFRSP
jgi:hypothetical protein